VLLVSIQSEIFTNVYSQFVEQLFQRNVTRRFEDIFFGHAKAAANDKLRANRKPATAGKDRSDRLNGCSGIMGVPEPKKDRAAVALRLPTLRGSFVENHKQSQ